jgi:hypothetical protein
MINRSGVLHSHLPRHAGTFRKTRCQRQVVNLSLWIYPPESSARRPNLWFDPFPNWQRDANRNQFVIAGIPVEFTMNGMDSDLMFYQFNQSKWLQALLADRR